MAPMTRWPWAKFTMSVTPKTSVKPMAMSAYTLPMKRPDRQACRTTSSPIIAPAPRPESEAPVLVLAHGPGAQPQLAIGQVHHDRGDRLDLRAVRPRRPVAAHPVGQAEVTAQRGPPTPDAERA